MHLGLLLVAGKEMELFGAARPRDISQVHCHIRTVLARAHPIGRTLLSAGIHEQLQGCQRPPQAQIQPLWTRNTSLSLGVEGSAEEAQSMSC